MTGTAELTSAAPPAKRTLRDLTEDMLTVNRWLDEESDEIAVAEGEVPAHLVELLDSAEGDFDEKVERIGFLMRDLDTDIEVIKAEEKRLAARRKAIERRYAWLDRYVFNALEAAKRTVKRPLITLRVQNGPKKVVADKGDLGFLTKLSIDFPQFVRVIPEQHELDSRAVLDAVKLDPTLELPAGISVVQTRHLRIA